VTESLIPDRAFAAVGQEFRRATGTTYKQEFQRWAAAVGDHNPLYFDEAFARHMGYRDVIAPPMYLSYITAGVMTFDSLTPDGRHSGANASDVRLPACPRRMAGGEEWTFHGPIYDLDPILSVRTLHGIEQKQGRSGSFVLLVWKTVYFRGVGDSSDLVAESLTTHVARQ
jgi:acyl dehydratase